MRQMKKSFLWKMSGRNSQQNTLMNLKHLIHTHHIQQLFKLDGRVSDYYKVAASIVGILLTAGVAFAAIHIVRMVSQSQQQMQSSQTTSAKPATSAISTDTIQSDTTISAKPIVFDNVPLDKMLSQIASYYHKEVVFQNVDARNLRFYFVWKPEDSLETVLHRLNLFESITIEQKSDKIVVE